MISWIGDLASWMRTAAAVLRPAGRLVPVDLHPLFNMVTDLHRCAWTSRTSMTGRAA